MMDELKNAENKMIEEENKKQEIIKQKETEPKETEKEPKQKDVFVKLKNYNKESTNKQSILPSRNNKNSVEIPNHIKSKIVSIQNQSSSDSHILKENANRYTHKGKFSNFIILKQVDKTKTNKNYSLSYKDYVEMAKNEINKK